jgi:hypothetical protein
VGITFMQGFGSAESVEWRHQSAEVDPEKSAEEK